MAYYLRIYKIRKTLSVITHTVGLISMWIWINIIIFVYKKKSVFYSFLLKFFFFCNGSLHDFSGFWYYVRLPHLSYGHLLFFFFRLPYLVASRVGSWSPSSHICLIKSDLQSKNCRWSWKGIDDIFLVEGNEPNSNTDNGL